MIKSMELAWVTVTDIRKAKQFFVETLGLQVTDDAVEHGWLELTAPGDTFVLGIGQVQPNNQQQQDGCGSVKPGHNAIVTMTVDNLIEAKRLLEQKHVKMLGDVIDIPGHVKMQLFADFDGNKFQLVEILDEQ